MCRYSILWETKIAQQNWGNRVIFFLLSLVMKLCAEMINISIETEVGIRIANTSAHDHERQENWVPHLWVDIQYWEHDPCLGTNITADTAQSVGYCSGSCSWGCLMSWTHHDCGCWRRCGDVTQCHGVTLVCADVHDRCDVAVCCRCGHCIYTFYTALVPMVTTSCSATCPGPAHGARADTGTPGVCR